MMADGPVLLLDSGIGGLSYVSPARELLPKERFFYIADNRHFPYGEKPYEEVLERAVFLTGICIELFRPKAVVVACNTASVIALAALRRRYSVPFIGVVPAVKPAAEQSKSRKIGIFATNRTVGDVYTANLIREFAPDCSVVSYPGAETVAYIEERYFSDPPEARDDYIRGIARQFSEDGIDSLVLGCTHFVFLADRLQEMLQGRIDVIDSRAGVARQLQRVLFEAETAAGNTETAPPEGRLYVTMEPGTGSLFPFLAGQFGLQYRGVLPAEETVR